MSDQLEAEVQETVETEVETEVNTEVETVEAQTETTSDTVSDSGENHEEKPQFTPEQKATAGYAFEARKVKRENEELRQQLAEAQQPVSNDRPAVQELSDFPEPEEIVAFQKATQDAAIWDYQQTQQKEVAYQTQVDAQNRQAEQLQDLQNTFVVNSKNAGIKLEDLDVAGKLVEAHGLSPQIAQALMNDKELGGHSLLYLAANTADIVALNNATDILQLGTIYADIRAKAAKLKPKQTDTPQPAEILSGAGATPKKHPALEGVIYS